MHFVNHIIQMRHRTTIFIKTNAPKLYAAFPIIMLALLLSALLSLLLLLLLSSQRMS